MTEPQQSLRDTARGLPAWAHRDDIVAAVRDHQVVVIEGPTGSGKTTQVPQMLLEAGLCGNGIALTQPRRIAAVSIAWRVAAELGVSVGREVGYAIRFDDCSSEGTQIRVMTDGILLQEARTDPDFERYGVIIVDEAHERSLNIDFTLGLMHLALQRRADLRLVISSATLDPGRFQAFYAGLGREVPLVHIDARPHPVDIQYRPWPGGDSRDMAEAIATEIAQLHRDAPPGNVLAFFSGQAGINQAVESLTRRGVAGSAELIPLYGALPREDQERVFHSGDGRRRIVLSTNIAETSVTVPGVRYVIDSGQAKVPRVSPATGIRSLREEGISVASAEQRAGRAGRTSPGVAIRLYARHWLERQPPFSDPAVLREDLREVVLRLIDLGVHDLENFPFPTEPPRRRLKAAVRQLEAMGAIDAERHLTDVGRRMTPFPLSPPLARAVVEAADRYPHALADVLAAVSFLAGRRPQAFPADQEAEARAVHERLSHPMGDAMTAVSIMRAYDQAENKGSFCKRSFLDPQAMAYIANSRKQLGEIAAAMGAVPGPGSGDAAAVIKSLASGFSDQILVSRGRQYLGPADIQLSIHPGSSLWGSRQRFLLAAEIIVLSRPYAAQVSVLRPEWLAEIDPELARRFRIRVPKDPMRRKGGVDAADLPKHAIVDGLELPVVLRRGRIQVEVPYDLVPALCAADSDAIDASFSRLKSRVVCGDQHFAVGTPLQALIRLLPHLPLPEPGADLRCRVPEGALLEADRNLHTLLRHLDDLLQPMLPSRGRKAGWLMLVGNGAGGWWFEVITDFREAVGSSLSALRELANAMEDDAEVQAGLDPRIDAMTNTLWAIEQAFQRDQGRGRGRS